VFAGSGQNVREEDKKRKGTRRGLARLVYPEIRSTNPVVVVGVEAESWSSAQTVCHLTLPNLQ